LIWRVTWRDRSPAVLGKTVARDEDRRWWCERPSGPRGIRCLGDQAAALSKVSTPDQQKLLSEEIQERVVSIFEACNFQDLTGQRINKVMTTMKFIENHITVMMDIWGGVDAIKAHAPPIVDEREGDAKLLNGPKLDGDVGHASQNDIDALFD
jgi:chemotaxis protein CheZ